ncbi:MAG: hypothetical protein ABF933_02100 [Leuconostoc citreum]
MLIQNIENFQISEEIAKILVQGVLKGYKDYAQERVTKQKEMIVSTGYLWTRSNHIDDAIAKEIESENILGDINFKVGRAGYIWDYIQFLHNNGEQSMIIVKPGEFRPAKYGDATDSKHLNQNSMGQLMSVNERHFSETNNILTEQAEQLGLFDDSVPTKTQPSQKEVSAEIANRAKSIQRFYILTYSLNSKSSIDTIKLVMPNPQDNSVVVIQDLTDLIGDANLITTEESSALKSELPEKIAAPDFFFNVSSNENQEQNNEKQG